MSCVKLRKSLPLIKITQVGWLIFFGEDFGQVVMEMSWTRRWSALCLSFGLGVMLVSCSPPSSLSASRLTNSTTEALIPGAAVTPAPIALDSTQSRENRAGLGQVLPISTQAEIGDQIIQLEVAETARQRALGLMFRTELANNRGMLFPFDPPRPVSFWMKNVSIHLDMIFLYQGAVIAIEANVPPCAVDPCPVYGPERRQLVDQVIELRGGRAEEIGIQIGDRITISPLDPTATVTE